LVGVTVTGVSLIESWIEVVVTAAVVPSVHSIVMGSFAK